MTESLKTVYIGCALREDLKEFMGQVSDFKQAVRDEGYEVYDFVGLTDGTEKDVYEWDMRHCVRDCDIFIGVFDHPSTGLGMEFNEATRLGKSVLAIAHEESKITRMVLGASAVEPNVRFERYQQLADVLPLIGQLTTVVE